jgi:HAE1 family hydrophobic/amphiphilic exporter-1
MERLCRETMPTEIEHVFVRTGTSVESFASVMGGREGSNVIEMTVKLVPVARRDYSCQELANKLSGRLAELPGIVKRQVDAGNPMQELLVAGQRPLSVEIIGHDLAATDALAARISEVVRDTPGARDVTVSRSPGKPELLVEVDRRKASSLGLNVAAIGQTLRTYFYGHSATQFREAGEEYDIYLKLREDQRAGLSDIKAASFRNVYGQDIPLVNFATIAESQGPAEIERLNQERLVTVGADTYGRSLGQIVSDVERRVASLPKPPDVEVRYGGLVKEQRESFFDLTAMLLVGTVLVYMVMAAQFESLLHPFVIMFSVPFSFAGVAFALVFCGYAMSVITFVGVILLVGVVVNNAIVLVDYVNLLRARGFPLEEAVKETCRRRLRPILITTITTVFGLLPLALARGESAEVMRPLGATVIGGLTFSTLVTLVIVPVMYTILEKARTRGKSAVVVTAAEKPADGGGAR